MTFAIISTLLYALIAVVFFQPSAPRFFAAASFVAVTFSHELFFVDYDGLAYYGSAALLDLGIIVITSGINPLPKMVLRLHVICAVSIFINLLGWLLWLSYLPPTLYDMAFVALYAWALVTLIRRDKLDVGGYSLDSWGSCFRFNRSAWNFHRNKHEG